MTLKIEYFEGTTRIDVVSFNGSREEAARAAAAGLKALDAATQARIPDSAGRVIATVHPED